MIETTTMLRKLRLPSFAHNLEEVCDIAERNSWGYAQMVRHLAELELQERALRRTERLLRASDLPRDKTLAAFDTTRLPTTVRRRLASWCDGDFAERAENMLVFGLPGRGKSHLVAAIGLELVQRGISVLMLPAFKLVQRLLIARRELGLERELRKLDGFDVLIIDDIGYIQQDRDEMEVLFTLLSERAERRSVVITSNLVFSQWDRIFKDPLTTAAAIDRAIHHAIIVELPGPSYRAEQAMARNAEAQDDLETSDLDEPVAPPDQAQ